MSAIEKLFENVPGGYEPEKYEYSYDWQTGGQGWEMHSPIFDEWLLLVSATNKGYLKRRPIPQEPEAPEEIWTEPILFEMEATSPNLLDEELPHRTTSTGAIRLHKRELQSLVLRMKDEEV